MFRVNPDQEEQAITAMARFLSRMESTLAASAARAPAPPSLVERLETMAAFSQPALEVIRIELRHLARLLDGVASKPCKSQAQARLETILHLLTAANSEVDSQLARLEDELTELRIAISKPAQSYPEAFYCPLSHELMRDPVLFREGAGHSYERSELETWIAYCRRRDDGVIIDPMTQEVVDGELIPNYTLRDAIAAVCESVDESDAVNVSAAPVRLGL